MRNNDNNLSPAIIRKRWARSISSKQKRLEKNRRKKGVSKPVSNFNTRQPCEEIYAPENFSFIDNHDEITKLLRNLKRNAEKGTSVFLRMDNVVNLTPGTAALLLSVIDEFIAQRVFFKGNKPKNLDARDALERSGFFRYVNGGVENPDNLYCDDRIERKVDYKVDSALSAKLIHKAMKTVTGTSVKNPRIQSILIEMMANTVNHAYPDERRSPWWISVSHDHVRRVASFSFIDKGVGIEETLKLKLTQKLMNLFSSELDLVKSAFSGKFGSRTGLSYRGKGLPKIKSVSEVGCFSKFIVITNNVIYDFIGNKSKVMNESLEGTFYYFEIRGNESENIVDCN